MIDPIKWRPDWPTTVIIDPHGTKPHNAVLLGADRDNQLYYIKELKLKAVAREFAQELKKWYRGFKIIDIISDSLGSSEGSGGEGFKSFIQVLNEEGVRARATTWDEKSEEDFIERIKGVLAIPQEPDNFGRKLPKLRIFRGNVGIIGDIENVQWIKFKNLDVFKPKLDISNKDFLACLKYGLASNMKYGKEKATAWRRNKPITTYGINNKKGTEHWRRRFGIKRGR